MASSGLQLLGFLLALVGLGATVAATFMVEWREQLSGQLSTVHDGLWSTCSGGEIQTCRNYPSILKLPIEIQATRAVMVLSIFLSTLALLISVMGIKCTRFMDDKPESKSTTAMVGGILFMVSGLLALIITTWYVMMIIETANNAPQLESNQFGKAVFASWAGSILTMAGGAFLSCRRCSRSRSNESTSSNHFNETSKTSNYV